MLGLGTWEFHVDTMFYRGRALLAVAEKDGGYDVQLDIPGMDAIPPIEIVSIESEDNEIFGTARNALLGSQTVSFRIAFSVDENGAEAASGFMKVPFIGKISFKDGKKIA